MFHSAADIRTALQRLGRKLAVRDSDEYTVLICGGSALNLTRLFARTTRDVDALGIVSGQRPKVSIAAELPDQLVEAAREVALELHLDADWLNTAAAPLLAVGLPAGVLDRVERFEFGPCLTILAISRKDQVALKVYASLTGKRGKRHLEDLVRLKPTGDEMEFAVAWLLNRPTSAPFRLAVKRIVKGLGHPGLKAFRSPKNPLRKRKPLSE
jgi:hypothetical protein